MDFVRWLRQDLQYALRLQGRNPGFSAVVLLSLALGIGANTAIFQLLDAVRLRSLPVRDPQELALVRIKGGSDGMGIRRGYGSDLTYPLWEGLRNQQQAFSGAFAVASSPLLAGKGAEVQAVTIAVLTCIAFGLAPAFRSSQINPGLAMKSGGRGLTSPRERFSLQRLLVVVQISVSLVLLFGALLFVQSLRNLGNVDAGFRQNGILFLTAGDPTRIRQGADAAAFRGGLLDEVRTIPRVESAALSSHVPLTDGAWSFFIHATNAQGEKRADAWSRFTYISPEYFRTMGTPMIQGRDFNDRDTSSSRKVAIVNETFVRRYIHQSNPIGTLVRTVGEPGYPAEDFEVIGVVKDTKYTRLKEEGDAITFVPSTQEANPPSIAGLTVRFSGPSSQVVAEIRRRLGESYSGMIIQFQPVETLVRDGLIMERLMAWLSGFFGVLAAVLAVIGLYGVLSYMVQTRINEIGIRLALGSTRARVITLVVRETAFLLLAGLTAGAIGALAASRTMSALLFGLSPGDTNTLIASASVLALIAAAASYIPAWRASRVDPMVALRHD